MSTPAEHERPTINFPFQSPTTHSSDTQLRRRSWVVAMDRVRRERREETERQNVEATEHQMMEHLGRNADLALPSEQVLSDQGSDLHQNTVPEEQEEVMHHAFHHQHSIVPSNASGVSARRPMLRLRPTQQLDSNTCLACGRTVLETPRSRAAGRRISIPPTSIDCPCRHHQRSFEEILYNDTSNDLEFLSPCTSDRFVLRLPNAGSQEDVDMGEASLYGHETIQPPYTYAHDDESRHKISLRPKRRHSDPFTSPTLKAMDETMGCDEEDSVIDESPFSLDEELVIHNKKNVSSTCSSNGGVDVASHTSKKKGAVDWLPAPPLYSVGSMDADASIDMSRHSTSSGNNFNYNTPNNYQLLLSRTPARQHERVQLAQDRQKEHLLQPRSIPIHANQVTGKAISSKVPLLPFMTPESVRPVTSLPDLQALAPQRGGDEDEAEDDVVGPPPPPFNGSASLNFCYDGSATDLQTPVQVRCTTSALPDFPMFTPN